MNKFLMGCFSLAVLLLVAFVIPTRLAADGGVKADCYPRHITVINPGDTSAKGEARGTNEEIEVETHGAIADYGPSNVGIDFKAAINGGISTGRAEVKIKWTTPLTGGINETTFNSGCVQEIQTAYLTGTKGVGEFEGEYEGSVENFPGYPGTSKAAVLSIVVHEDPNTAGRLELDFTIELGYTCEENIFTGGDGDIELGKVALTNLSTEEFKITNSGQHGQWSFPDGFSPCEALELAAQARKRNPETLWAQQAAKERELAFFSLRVTRARQRGW